MSDERIQTHASLMRLLAEMYQEPEGKRDVALAEGMRAMPLFRRHRDDLGLARAWRLVADSYALKGRVGELEEAARHIEEHAAAAEDGQLRAVGTAYRTGAILFGPRPVREGIALLEELLAQPSELRRVEPAVLKDLALLCAMDGDVPQARELVARAMALTEQLGLTLARMLVRNRAGLVELLAGEPESAEQEFRRACEELERMHERSSYLSNAAAQMGEALLELARLDEAEEATRLSEETAASDDVMSQVVWRGVRAQVLAARGELEPAEKLARDALALVATTDFLDLHGDALRRLAAVLRAAGRIEDARAATEEAFRLHERKGNVMSAARGRVLLEELGSAPVAAS